MIYICWGKHWCQAVVYVCLFLFFCGISILNVIWWFHPLTNDQTGPKRSVRMCFFFGAERIISDFFSQEIWIVDDRSTSAGRSYVMTLNWGQSCFPFKNNKKQLGFTSLVFLTIVNEQHPMYGSSSDDVSPIKEWRYYHVPPKRTQLFCDTSELRTWPVCLG